MLRAGASYFVCWGSDCERVHDIIDEMVSYPDNDFGVPEDFIVEEIPLYEPSGEGGHTFLWVEKRLRNTDEVAKLLARAAGVSERDVGYAGRKDRHAVTRQSFSVPGFDPEAALAVQRVIAEIADQRGRQDRRQNFAPPDPDLSENRHGA